MLAALHTLVHLSLEFYLLVLIVTIVASWLVAFGVINPHNRFVDMVLRTCHALTEPVLRPLRNLLPNLGGIDISPIFVFIGIRVLQSLLHNTIFEGVGY